MMGFFPVLGNFDTLYYAASRFPNLPPSPPFLRPLIEIDSGSTIHNLSPLLIWSIYVLVQFTVRGFQPPRGFIVAD